MQVDLLTFGGRTYFRGGGGGGGMIQRSEKSRKEEVCSIQCFPHTTRCCACFSDYAHISRIQGYLYLGGMYFRGIAADSKFQEKNEGVLIFGGVLIYGVLRYYFSFRTARMTSKLANFSLFGLNTVHGVGKPLLTARVMSIQMCMGMLIGCC